MEQTPVVQIRHLTKVIGGKVIVDDLSFDVPRGEVFGFLGPNGAGKTTTIRMIVGLISITRGQVLIGGHDVQQEFEQAMRHVGAIVENPEMYKFLSGYQNLVHFARMIPGIPASRIQEVVELVGLENRIHDKVKTYSLGMRQRLGLAQALLHKPSVLILDEPTNGLDPAGIRELRDHLRHLAEVEGIAVIVSSHLLSEMELMCDRVAIIQNGRLVDVQRLTEMVQKDETQQVTVVFDVERAEAVREWLLAIRERGDRLTDASATLPLGGLSLEEAGHLLAGEIRVREGSLWLQMSRDQIPEVNRLLVRGGFDVYGIRTATKTLEDTFLEMTGGGSIA